MRFKNWSCNWPFSLIWACSNWMDCNKVSKLCLCYTYLEFSLRAILNNTEPQRITAEQWENYCTGSCKILVSEEKVPSMGHIISLTLLFVTLFKENMWNTRLTQKMHQFTSVEARDSFIFSKKILQICLKKYGRTCKSSFRCVQRKWTTSPLHYTILFKYFKSAYLNK